MIRGGGRPEAGGRRGAFAVNRLADPMEPVHPGSLVALRVIFGLLGFVGAMRFFAYGWIERFYTEPAFHFTYWGFDWVRPLPEPWTTALFVVIAVSALCIAVGAFYRAATIVFVSAFTYVELIDVATYLNHYYLVSVVGVLLCVMPLHRAASVDAWLRPSLRDRPLRRWMIWLLRFQVGIVYVNAALAKAGPDWLWHAQPLNIWLAARPDLPVIGELFGSWVGTWEFALFMSWAGFLYDLLIVPALLWRRTRPFAYVAVIGFHTMTGLLFDIGMFPFIMIGLTTIFFGARWPVALANALTRGSAEGGEGSRHDRTPSPASRPDATPAAPCADRAVQTHGDGSTGARPRRMSALAVGAIVAWCGFHVAMPLRTHLYDGDVLWHEQGMRWSWRVMVREKNGAVTFRVRPRGAERDRWHVSPSDYLTAHQEREMAGQPDLILQLAHHIGDEFRSRLGRDVEVRVDAIVSLNGRAPRDMIDPEVDLMTIDDGLTEADWILDGPDEPPIRLDFSARARSGSSSGGAR